MVERLDYKIVGLAMLFLLCWMGYYPIEGRSAIVWSDDFDDGNFDGWTICENAEISTGSDWSAADNYLQLEEDTWSSFFGLEWGVISHPSNVAYGNWSFDFKANDSSVEVGAFVSIMFVSNNITALTDINDWSCYWVYFEVVSASEFTVKLRKNLMTIINTTDTNVPVAGWHHIEVTRTESGLFSVYHNGSLIIQDDDTGIDTSEMFAFAGQKGIMIDNIVVDNEIPTTPPTTPTSPSMPLELLVVGAGVVVVIVVIVIILRRRG